MLLTDTILEDLAIFSFLSFIYLFFKLYTLMSLKARKLNNLLEKNDVYILSNEFCKCYNMKLCNFKYKMKCNLCQIKRVIDFEEEKDVYYLLENIGKNVNLLIHTEGGITEFANFIPYILSQQNIKLNTFIPRFALSAGSFIALASKKIYMNWFSSMGPIDTQLSYCYANDDSDNELEESFPAKHIREVRHKTNAVTKLKSMEADGFHTDDIFILNKIFKNKNTRKKIIRNFLDTKRSHSVRYGPSDLKRFGLNIDTNIPEEIKEIFNIFKDL